MFLIVLSMFIFFKGLKHSAPYKLLLNYKAKNYDLSSNGGWNCYPIILLLIKLFDW